MNHWPKRLIISAKSSRPATPHDIESQYGVVQAPNASPHNFTRQSCWHNSIFLEYRLKVWALYVN